MMWFEPLRFPADNVDQMLLVFFQGHEPRQFLHGAGHGRQRLANFVGDRGGKTAQRGHAFLGGHFLLQAAQFGQVLEIENVAAARASPVRSGETEIPR